MCTTPRTTCTERGAAGRRVAPRRGLSGRGRRPAVLAVALAVLLAEGAAAQRADSVADTVPRRVVPLAGITVTVTRAPLSDAWQPLAELLIARIEDRPLAELQRWGQVEVMERGSVSPP